MKFLIDEDLSPKVAERLRQEEGIDAIHVRDRGMLGAVDQVVLQRAYQEDRILITANVKDFQRLARSIELHPGIILLLNGALSRERQLVIVRRAINAILEELREGGDMVNRILEIDDNGELQFYDLPKP